MPESDEGGRVLPMPGPPATLDDAGLVRALLDRHPQAARAAWTRFAPMVHRMLKRALGYDSEIEDLAQQVFMALFDRVRTLQDPTALKAFIISITTHTIRYELRRRTVRRWVRLGGTDDAAALPTVHPDPEAREALVRFYRVLDRLTSQDRTAFVLRFMEELELVEVAAAMGVSLATVKRRLAKARRRVLLLVERDPALQGYLAAFKPREAEA